MTTRLPTTVLVTGGAGFIGSNFVQHLLGIHHARAILDLLGKSHDLISFVPDRLGHVRRHAVDSAKLTSTLGWWPRMRFHEGITSTIDWYQTHTDWLEQVISRQDSFLQGAFALAKIYEGQR